MAGGPLLHVFKIRRSPGGSLVTAFRQCVGLLSSFLVRRKKTAQCHLAVWEFFKYFAETDKSVCQVLDLKMEKCGTALSGKNCRRLACSSSYVEWIFYVGEGTLEIRSIRHLLFKEVELKLFSNDNWNENLNYCKNWNGSRTEIFFLRTVTEIELKGRMSEMK